MDDHYVLVFHIYCNVPSYHYCMSLSLLLLVLREAALSQTLFDQCWQTILMPQLTDFVHKSVSVVFCAASTNVGLSQVSSTPPILLRRHCATLVTTDDWLAALHSNTTPGNWHPLPSLPHTRDAIYNKNCLFFISRSFTRSRTLASPQSWRDFFTIAYNTSCMTHHTGMAFTVKPFHMCVY